ncbi:MAG: hypothetical protein M1820_007182 [Bogoriella megaspora]|nr:MAG: hypothetical protein M1820_007182 [Bogoriella megaspora]
MPEIDHATLFLSAILMVSTLSAAITNNNSTSFSIRNSTIGPSTSLTSNNSQPFCCQVLVDVVGLNVWYTSPVIYYKETIITEYVQYNNTAVPSTTKVITNDFSDTHGNVITYGSYNGASGTLPLAETVSPCSEQINGDYCGLVVEPSTAWTNEQSAIVSPTPFATISQFYVVTGIPQGSECVVTITPDPACAYDSENTTDFCTVHELTAPADFQSMMANEEFGQVPYNAATMLDINNTFVHTTSMDLNEKWMHGGNFQNYEIPGRLLEWLASQPGVLSQVPRFKECSVGGGEGAPTVHIPVAELTSYSSSYIPVGGVYRSRASNTHSTGTKITTAASQGSPSSGRSESLAFPEPLPVTSIPKQTGPTIPFETQSMTPADPHTDTVRNSGSQSELRTASNDVASRSRANFPLPVTVKPAPSVPAHHTPSSIAPITNSKPGSTAHDPATNDGAASNILSAIQQGASEIDGNSQTSAPVIIGGMTASELGSGTFILSGGRTIAAGGSPVVESSTTYSIDQLGAVVINDIPISRLTPYTLTSGNVAPHGAAEIGNVLVTLSPVPFSSADASHVASKAFVLSGQTLYLGGSPVTVSGTTCALDSSGRFQINGQTVSTLASDNITPLLETYEPVAIGSAIALPIASDAFVLSGKTLRAGGAAATVSGTTYSLSPSGAVIVNGQSISSLAAIPAATDFSAITLGTHVIAAHPTSQPALVIFGKTLFPGGTPVTISANGHLETLSLPTDALLPNARQLLVVNGKTETLAQSQTALTGSDGAVFSFTPTMAPGMVLGGQTLIAGGTAIFNGGATISERPDGAIIKISEGVTSTLGSEVGGIGSYIMSGFGTQGSVPSGLISATSVPAPFLGKGDRLRWRESWGVQILSMSIFALVIFI